MNKIENLREEFIDFYRYGQSSSPRCALEIWSDIKKLLIEVGLNKSELLAVFNALLAQVDQKEKEENE